MHKTPIILSTSSESDLPHTELLINLSQSIPENFQRFSRVIEIISNDQQQLQTGRQRFSQYKQQGYSPSHLIADSTHKG